MKAVSFPALIGNLHRDVQRIPHTAKGRYWLSAPGQIRHALTGGRRDQQHHYRPDVPLPSGVFDPFQEVIWQPRGSMQWDHPQIIGQANIVARFAADRRLEFASLHVGCTVRL